MAREQGRGRATHKQAGLATDPVPRNGHSADAPPSARIELLERENARLRDFAAMAAHELVKPLVMIEGSGIAVRERTRHGIDLDSRHELETIIDVAARMRRFVDALLLETTGVEATTPRQPVDVKQVIDECVTVLARDIEASDASVEVDPMPIVQGNPVLLGGIFGNLLANAIKFLPGRGEQIQVKALRSDAAWVFAVEAPGPPLPKHDRQSLFEPRRRGAAARAIAGTGMGLAVVRQIVESHGGSVGVKSHGNSINSFFFTLPF